jgi:hypothetical protein
MNSPGTWIHSYGTVRPNLSKRGKTPPCYESESWIALGISKRRKMSFWHPILAYTPGGAATLCELRISTPKRLRKLEDSWPWIQTHAVTLSALLLEQELDLLGQQRLYPEFLAKHIRPLLNCRQLNISLSACQHDYRE